MRNLMWGMMAVAMLVAAGGCATPGSSNEIDRRFEAGWRPSKTYCLFGGETPKVNAYCALQNFGYEGYLAAINQQALLSLPEGAHCREHTAAVAALLKDQPDLRSQMIYSCPKGVGPGVPCHVSILATTPDGRQWVLDNGAIVNATVGVSGVVAMRDFAAEVQQAYWVDRPPTMMQAMFPDMDLEIALPPDAQRTSR